MLKKLLKYDLKYLYKFLIIFYILSIFFAVITRILFAINNTAIIDIISKISVGCLFAVFANIIINTLMRNWVVFKNKFYGDESYLTHTLPISKNTLYTSKFITTLVTLFSSFIVIIISLIITYYDKDLVLTIKNYLSMITNSFDMNYIIFIILVLFILYIELYTVLQSGMLGIILGNRKNNNHNLYSVIFGFIVYSASQIIILLSIFIYGLFNKNIMNLFLTNNVDMSIITPVMVMSLIVYIIINLIIKYIAEKYLNKGVNVI